MFSNFPRQLEKRCFQTALSGLVMLGSFFSVIPTFSPAIVHAKTVAATTEVWPGRRVVLLLPLQLSDNWNADPQWGQRLLFPAETRLRRALEATGKFSVIQPYQFDPVLQRALQEKRIEKAQLDAVVETPTVQTTSDVLSKLNFQLQPLIAEFRLEEVRSSGDPKKPSVQVQVLGKLYELNSEAAAQTKVFTSDPIRRRGAQFDQVLDAADNAFRLVANDFVRPPAEIELPRIDPPKTPAATDGKEGAKPSASGGTPPVAVAPNAAGSAVPAAPPATPAPAVVGPPLTTPINPEFNPATTPAQRTP